MQRKKMSKSTLAVTLLSIVLVATLAVGATLAFLVDVTESRINNFTLASPDLSARLVEPHWDDVIDYVYEDGVPIRVFGYTEDGEPIFGYTNGNLNQPILTPPTSSTVNEDGRCIIRPRCPEGRNPNQVR